MEQHGYSARYMAEAAAIAQALDATSIDSMARGLAEVRKRGGRLFILGVGGGAGHASHAVNDFRKLCGIESYAPTDNVSELTARTNDDGWETSFSAWLEISRLGERDALLVFSVGGGSREHNVSTNLVGAMETAREVGASIYGIVGVPGGALAELADVAILIEPPPALRTPLVESFQAVVWHALVSNPELAIRPGHWESLRSGGRNQCGAQPSCGFPRSRRGHQRGNARPRNDDARVAAAGRGCSTPAGSGLGAARAEPRRLRARLRLEPAGGGEGQGLAPAAARRARAGPRAAG
jgi:D-sedoheptulose 7-phosphate isomerase